ncbi:LPS export ABC transporter permease LptG [Jiella sp. MQZ9-1]|uniref:LPS export ABC transporter permease LptG n=1 Tax=Jiella flava TaxID=2816857 RepID=A0A939JVH7_9HYPH|nr:LPS export ABC transporter permease LptG [Jiella flava]MBO0661987.1 LPS export ABC transporter permease LptG [Jiella flava]MCD2470686.1 LPS export ABC transporter permease LptG [Jiella flava]
MINRTLNLYFLRLYLTSFFSTLLALFALIFLVDMIELSRRGRVAVLGFESAVAYSAMRIPTFMEQALPFIILFASIFTLLNLNRRLELVVARAAGVSIWQIILPFAIGSVMLGLAATFLYNPLAAWTKAHAQSIETNVFGNSSSNSNEEIWLRQNANGVRSIIGGAAVTKGGTELRQVSVFLFGNDGAITQRIDADRATLQNGQWVLSKPRVTRIGYPPSYPQEYRLPTTLKPAYIEQRVADPQAISVWSLPSEIKVASSLGLNPMAFAMQFEMLLAQPALFLAMTLVAATVGTRFSRTSHPGRAIAAGVLAGFTLYVITYLAKALGSNDIVPPVVAAWFPVLAAGSLGVTILLHQEDG